MKKLNKSAQQTSENKWVSTDSPLRSLVKAITWRLTGTLDTFLISWFITGQPLLATGIALTEVFTKVFLFWLHERIWNRIGWMRT